LKHKPSILCHISSLTPDHYLGRMEKRDCDDLKTAVNLLEKPGLSIRLINLLGYPIEGIIKPCRDGLASNWKDGNQDVGQLFCSRCLRWIRRAVTGPSMDPSSDGPCQRAVGGFFGLPGLIFELPISTTLMLRSIADIARSEGENLSSLDTHLACNHCFALGGRSRVTMPLRQPIIRCEQH